MIDNNFLLQNDIAKELYNNIKGLPIIDYHNHLDPKEIYENIPFKNISNLWLSHDHSEWRLMRFAGFSDHEDDPLSNFINFSKAVESAYLNPVFHWSHMELKTFFKVEEQLTKENAKRVYNQANKYLKDNPLRPRDLLKDMNVESLCTTDDLSSDLKYHKLLADDDNFNIKVLPTFRPDKLFTFESTKFYAVIEELNEVTDKNIINLSMLEDALIDRIIYFNINGCKLSDHGITHFVYHSVTIEEANTIFIKRNQHKQVSNVDIEKLNCYLLGFFLREYASVGWTVQYHIGALRNNNTKMYEKYGNDAGYDSISHHDFVDDLNKFFDSIYKEYTLPRIIIYPLNKSLYEAVATLCSNFSEDKPGKIQLGAAWWFHDHLSGIEKQLSVFAEYLHINYFMGMVTDSRSFISFVRHDYFRRVLANFIGKKVEDGLIPSNMKQLIELVQNISYYNSKKFLDL